jgi:hypothetical protein
MSYAEETANRLPGIGGNPPIGGNTPVLNERTFVTVYEEANFQGASQTYICFRRVGTPTIGDHSVRIDFSNLGIRNDSLSSLKIEGAFGVSVTLFEDAGFRGRSKVIEGRGVVGYVGDDFNDRTSSIWIQPL